MDVSGVIAPGEEVTSRSFKFVPSLVSRESVGVEIFEEFCSEHLFNEGIHLITAWPDILKKDVVTVLVLADGFSFVIDVDSTGEGISYHERGTCKVVGPCLWVNTAFKVSISRQDSRCHEVIFFDCILDFFWDITTVADTSHASITCSGKAKLV